MSDLTKFLEQFTSCPSKPSNQYKQHLFMELKNNVHSREEQIIPQGCMLAFKQGLAMLSEVQYVKLHQMPADDGTEGFLSLACVLHALDKSALECKFQIKSLEVTQKCMTEVKDVAWARNAVTTAGEEAKLKRHGQHGKV